MLRVAGVIAAVIALLLVTQVFLGRRPPPPAPRGPRGEAVLRMRRGRYASLCSLALAPAAIVSWIVLTLRPTPNDWAAVLLASAVVTTCVATALWCLAAEFLACVRVDAGGLDWVGPLGHRPVTWPEIARLVHNPVNHWFFITLVDGSHLWLWDDLFGIDAFAALALASLPAPVLGGDPDARDALEELALGRYLD